MLMSRDCEYHLKTVFLQGKPGAPGKITPTQKQPSDQKSPQKNEPNTKPKKKAAHKHLSRTRDMAGLTGGNENVGLKPDFIPELCAVFIHLISKWQLLWQRPKSVSRRWSGEGDDFDWPQGTKDDPATTCYELGITHPELNDGDWLNVPSDSSSYTKHIRVIAYFSSRLFLYGP